ncbi:type II toxin-antitoxin system PemK/MazF family toxin [Marinospirillum sp.]|uniref:type II toxin-antitoxin system PemK/MazF family toxin n=1 Tax=Marinospirillum sp. TaxID=2183934 RepID=UPI0028701F04|nr:type II toxin-antitoxin system PemK/MazF family toxin [Marinospirillum sp.]MDR9467702.1 type II toxin-antitoxin system PemK/MazF family toxin [Marinospirillum sp.]
MVVTQGKDKRKILRGEVYWVNLDPTLGTEIRKTRPALIISPNDMNLVLPRVLIAPITSKGQPLGCRPELVFNNKLSRILLDQIRSVDKQRLLGKMGEISLQHWHQTLLEMLA